MPLGPWQEGEVTRSDGLCHPYHRLRFSPTGLALDLLKAALGQASAPAAYAFSAPITILAQGPSCQFGGSTSSLRVVNGTDLVGNEGDGAVQINGTFTSISWTTSHPENWNGFNLGAAQAVPEPSGLAGLGIAAAGLLGFAQRRKIQFFGPRKHRR